MPYPTYKDSGGNTRSVETVSGSAAGSNGDPDKNKAYVGGLDASDDALTGNPLPGGGRASDAEPTPVSADGDAVHAWLDRTGRARTALPGTVVSVTPTIDTNIFAAGDAVGGKQMLTNVARVSGSEVVLDSLTVVDKGNQKPNLTVLFFDSDPSAATITNNAAFVFSTDVSKLVGRVNVVTADFETVDSKAVACLKNVHLGMLPSGSRSLYAAVVLTSGTPTFLSAADLVFKYAVEQKG